MQVKSNSLLKILVPGVVLVALVILLRGCEQPSGGSASNNAAGNTPTAGPAQLTEQEKKDLGIEADSPRATVATLVGKIHAMQAQLEASQNASDKLRKENKHLAERNENVDTTIKTAMAKQNRRQNQHNASLMHTINQRLARLRGKIDSGASKDLPVGLGLGNGKPAKRAPQRGTTTWIEPLDQQTAPSGSQGSTSNAAASGAPSNAIHTAGYNPGPNASHNAAGAGSAGSAGSNNVFATAFDASGNGGGSNGGGNDSAVGPADAFGDNARAARTAAATRRQRVQAHAQPIYTVPKNATLVGSVAMTALLGRVPIDGTVQNPYPFKVVIGRNDLTTNGIEVPEVRGAIVSGTATGDWTLSCVRGTVRSITFIFQDGTVRTVPKSRKPSRSTSNNNNDNNREIGYISDPKGVPCIPGARKTNARQFITTSILLGAGAGAANALSAGQVTSNVTGLGSVNAVTGNAGKYIAGQAAANGLNQVRKWLQKRFGQTFDAIYVPPGHPVAVNIDKTLDIDYEPQGRKVHYAHNRRARGLD